MKRLLVVILIIGLSVSASAKSPGTVAAQFLKLSGSAAGSARAGCNIAAADIPDTFQINPAAASQLSGFNLALMYADWLGSLSLFNFAGSYSAKSFGTIFVTSEVLTTGKIDNVVLTSEGVLAPDSGTVSAWDMNFNLGYARNFTAGDNNFGIGLSLHSIVSSDEDSYSAFAVDVGGYAKVLRQRMELGLSVRNLGTPLDKSSLPIAASFGAQYRITPFKDFDILPALQFDYYLDDSNLKTRKIS